jgi:hypothetical protein
MFRSRNEWFVHELQNHRRHWICVLCATYFNNRTLFSDHLEIKHQVSTSDPQFGALILQSEEAVDTIPADACPFCDEWEETLMDPKHDARRAFLNDGQDVKPYGTLKQFRRHLGRHMEQLALFALPMAENEDPEDDSASGHHEDSVNSASTSVQAYDDDDNNYYVGGGGESSVLHGDNVGKAMFDTDTSALEQIEASSDGMVDLETAAMLMTDLHHKATAAMRTAGVEPYENRPGMAFLHGQEQMLVDAKNADPEFETLASDQRAHIDTKRSDEEVQSQAERAQEYLNISEEDIRKMYLLAEDLRKTGMNEEEIQLALRMDKKNYPDRPTSTRMSRKQLSLETLKRYTIDFEIDTDPDYLLIKRWVPEYEQAFLWDHTRELRQKRAENAEDIATSNFSAGSRRSPGDTELPEIAGEEEQRRQKIGEDDNVELISIESHPVGLIIGRKGENLRRIEAETGCRLQIVTGANVTGPYRQCKITGTRAARAKAKAEINRIIDDSGMAELEPEPENREGRKRYHSDDRISSDIRVMGDLNMTGRATTTSAASSSQPTTKPAATPTPAQPAAPPNPLSWRARAAAAVRRPAATAPKPAVPVGSWGLAPRTSTPPAQPRAASPAAKPAEEPRAAGAAFAGSSSNNPRPGRSTSSSAGGAAGGKRSLGDLAKGAIFREVVLGEVREMKESETRLRVEKEGAAERTREGADMSQATLLAAERNTSAMEKASLEAQQAKIAAMEVAKRIDKQDPGEF